MNYLTLRRFARCDLRRAGASTFFDPSSEPSSRPSAAIFSNPDLELTSVWSVSSLASDESLLALELECACQGYADQDLQVVCQSCHQRKQLLCHAHPASAGLLCMGKKGEEIDSLATQHACLSNVGHAYHWI